MNFCLTDDRKLFKSSKVKFSMIIPMRCFSCGKPIAHLWEQFRQRTEKGEQVKKVLDDLGLDRYCCRAIFMGHVDLLELTSRFKKF